MNCPGKSAVVFCTLIAMFLVGFHAPASSSAFTSAEVDKAIEDAVEVILKSQKPDGGWQCSSRSNPCGETSLALIALYDCGMSVRNPVWARGAKWLMEQDQPDTYGLALRIIALSIGARTDDRRYLPFLNKDARRMVRAIRPNGGWRYTINWKNSPRTSERSGGGDNSNSQYAVLALREAKYARVEIPAKVWKKLDKFWSGRQSSDGGWDYSSGKASYGSMSAAGLASSYIIQDMLLSHARGSRPVCRNRPYKPIVRALKWFDKYFSASKNPRPSGAAASYYHYYIYNIERIGATSGRKYFGKHDWYKEITAHMLAVKKRFKGRKNLANNLHDHCYATIFLAKSRAQVAINKLEYHDLDWDVHTRDVANLVRDMSRRFERLLNWQIVDMRRDVAELHNAPVLFLTGSRAIKADVEDVAKFRRYVLGGGTLLAQAACSSQAFETSFRDLCKRALPEYEMRPLSLDHPVYSAHSKLQGKELHGIDNGVRTCVLFMPKDLSFYWHRRMSETRKDAFNLGVNVVIYAMDKASFRHREILAPVAVVAAKRKITTALVRHPAGWNANPIVLEQLSDALSRKTGISLDVKPPVDLGKSDLSDISLLWLSGYREITLPDAQREALAKFLASGGTLFIDAANGNEDFYVSATTMLDKLLPTAKRKQASRLDAIISGKFGNPDGFDVSNADYRRVLRVEKRGDKLPELLLYSLGNRVAVMVSRHDVSSGIGGQNPWACRGYKIDFARKLGVNAVLQVDQDVKAGE